MLSLRVPGYAIDIRAIPTGDGAIVLPYGHGVATNVDAPRTGNVPRNDGFTPLLRNDLNDTVVIDSRTDLMWSKATLGEAKNWADAKRIAAACALGGFTDWALPTIEQLQTIIDYSRHNPAIDVNFFPDTRAARYYSSSPDASDPEAFAWGVLFDYGLCNLDLQSYTGWVRAVRRVGAALPSGQ